MKKYNGINGGKSKGIDMKKYYIITKPTSLSNLSLDDYEEDDTGWRAQSRQLQARRWRKLRHQMI